MAVPEQVVAVALAKKTVKTIKKKSTLSRTKKAAKKAKSPKKKAKSPKKKGTKKKAAKKKAKKKPAKKKKKRKKAKKKKKKRKKAKKKKKKTRKEGGRISAKSKAAGRKKALAMKAKGLGIFAPKTLSKDLAAICGGGKMPRTQVTKKIWAYIKAKKLNKGRTITPDAALKKVFPVASCDMLKLAGMLSKHLK